MLSTESPDVEAVIFTALIYNAPGKNPTIPLVATLNLSFIEPYNTRLEITWRTTSNLCGSIFYFY